MRALALSCFIPLLVLVYVVFFHTVLKPSDSTVLASMWVLIASATLLTSVGSYLIWDVTNAVTRSAELATRELVRRADELNALKARHDLDPLTGLANRTLFCDELARALARADRDNQVVALILLDVDRLKAINEVLGHDAGDFLLKGVAGRVRNCLRKMDTVAVARVEGATFGVILEGLPRVPDPATQGPWPEASVAKRLLDSLLHPFIVAGQEVFVAASIGIALYPRDGTDANALITRSELALRRAKAQGGSTYRFFRLAMDSQVVRSVALESSLRRALQREEFQLHYQPRVDLQRGEIVGMEALLRWSHPEHGVVSPAEFIPVAERSGLIASIGEWVLHQACAQNQAWQAQGLPPLRVSVNVSASQFREGELVRTVTRAVKGSGLDPEYLELEVTEGVLIQDSRFGKTTLMRLKEMGVQLCIDDFGTGYSSFAYLKQFPIDVIKIDRSFVSDVTTDPAAAAIVVAIISLGQSLRLTVVAEGVETEEQLAFLRAQGCDAIQGYLFSRPLPPEAFVKLIREERRFGRP